MYVNHGGIFTTDKQEGPYQAEGGAPTTKTNLQVIWAEKIAKREGMEKTSKPTMLG